MKHIASLLLSALLLVPGLALADQPTTVLTEVRNTKGATVNVPYIDGANDETLEKAANQLLNDAAEDLAGKAGRGGTVSYEVTLDRPSLVSVLLTAKNGGSTYHRAVNVDLTSGKEFGLNGFFFDNDKRKELVGSKAENVLFTESGVRVADHKGGSYDRYYSYGQLVPCVRIGDIGRLLRVWKLTENAAGKSITVHKGDLLAIKLSANPTTGMQWIRTIDGPANGLVANGESFVMPRDTPTDSSGASAGTLIQFLGAMTPGTYTVRMSYQKPWDKMGGIRQFTYTVIVKE
ncbi:MAG: protease inhibitor I42 family protein [Succiniclasticum sp.]|jgi:predicted secreted protein|nr:protease inhibitor I42 family protein [Succiniclasticum sp.]MEE3479270.1 protease inhibitor I42 family protein [Succiniclasticum sp.]